MELKDAKKLIKKIGVKSWIESGTNVVKIGDKLIDPTESFSRLDYYAKHMGIKFCNEDELTVPCGEIYLNNDMLICYNVITEIL